jgi:pyruvate-formate lyase
MQTVRDNETDWSLLEQTGEFMAAGYMQRPEASPLVRFSLALKRFFETCPLPEYGGEAFYPCSGTFFGSGQVMTFHYSGAMVFNLERLDERISEATDEDLGECLQRFREVAADYPRAQGYTHSIVNFGRVLAEGLNGYRRRIEGHKCTAEQRDERERVEFYEALLILLDGIAALHGRCCDLLAQSDEPGAERILTALQRVPFEPAQSFYEAMVGTNFIYYVDGCDDLGRLDQELWPYYRDGLANGEFEREEAVAWVGRLFDNVNICNGWNTAIGGTAVDGTEGANDLTLVCIEAAKGRRRPNLALRLRRDTPEEVWDQALDTISGGTGIPALYNEEEYVRAIHEAHLGVARDDIPHLAFGGCTELMVHGRSNVGSVDDYYNLALCLENSLHQHLGHCTTFGEFVEQLKAEISREILEMTDKVSAWQESKATWQPQPIRTLLIDDCIDNGMEFNAGGARYNWSVISISGLSNTYDSLAAVREVVYDTEQVSASELLDALEANFEGYEDLRRRLGECPRFGNDDPYVDDLAAEIAEHTFRQFLKHAPWRGGKYLGACLMFVTYGPFGEPVGALPDGRLAGTPVGDSAGAFQGRDVSGPTALVKSATRVPNRLAPGTLVTNIRFTKRLFDDPQAREHVKALIRTYFELGGMQLQINVVDQEILKDAIEHPERHGDLIVRVGGYSEYFNRLSDGLKLTVLERVEHG